MEAGKLRHWLIFERLEESAQDSDGFTTEAWVNAFDVPNNSRLPCAIEDISGRELIAAAAVASQVTTRITIRYRPGVTAKMRCRDARTVYNIEAVIADKGSRIDYLTLLCSSGTNAGGTA